MILVVKPIPLTTKQNAGSFNEDIVINTPRFERNAELATIAGSSRVGVIASSGNAKAARSRRRCSSRSSAKFLCRFSPKLDSRDMQMDRFTVYERV